MGYMEQDWLILETFDNTDDTKHRARCQSEKWRRRDEKASLDLDFLLTLSGYGSQG